MKLAEIVPWGRSCHEYQEMFSLDKIDLEKKVLGCGDGPASFNAEMTKVGGNIVSIDPVYNFSANEIKARIEEVKNTILSQAEKNKADFVWENITSVEELGKTRMTAMTTFLEDFEMGKASGRYLHGTVEDLPFKNNTFDLALCSHFLFLYSDLLDAEFHMKAIKELMRVADELRIFPLLNLKSILSPWLEVVKEYCLSEGFLVNAVAVNYQFQKGANKMLVIKKR